MGKNYFIFAAALIALASCSSDDILGGAQTEGNEASNAIQFGGETGKITRAGEHVGADAAALLNNQFIVAGFKGTQQQSSVVETPVFDHYTVKWAANTAGTSDDNTADWSYVGSDPQTGLATVTGKQTIKYWDFSAGQYDYIAFSVGKATIKTGNETATGDDEVKVTKVTPKTATTSAYTIQGTAEALHKCYIADLVTAYNNPTQNNKPKFKDQVNLTFRNLTTKARVAFYETIPGYSVKEVKFYTNNTDELSNNITNTNATLFTEGTADNNKFYGSGTATVKFPTVGTANINNSDYNKAHVSIASTAESGKTTQDFSTLNYKQSEDTRLSADGNVYLGTTSKEATYAGAEANHYYQTVLPNEAGTTLTLRVNYTLVANDGSKEEIHVYGAKAIIPAKYAEWKSNYAYTYLFKISDNTNGKTNTGTDTPEGLYPITFDAVVADAEDGNQSTITTVATPSITTYQKGHDLTKDEYSVNNNDIYVMVHNDNELANDLNTEGKTKLYTIEDSKNIGISEATVHDALTIGTTTEGNVTTGRNGIKLTTADLKTSSTTIPGVDGNNITVTAGQVANFTPEAGKTYAFVYKTTKNQNPTKTNLVSAITFAEETDLDNKGYFTDEACSTAATGKSKTNVVYYQQITNTNETFAIKIIKVAQN